ncbi:thioredoxin family protein [bacterium]|nr:thioredoxin family protein [bacterium]MBU1990410.1 thioredoxin family protein [bacterium]
MSKIILIASLLVSSLFAEIHWMKYDDAIEKAKKENKIVMVMLSREDCPTCEYMDDIVFEDDNVVNEFNKDFLGVHLDIHNDFIPEGLTYIGTPTFHFLNKSERRLDRIDGGANARDFRDKLKEVKANN